jgi:serine/threonine-protein kinase
MSPDVLRRAERRVGTTLCRKWHIDSVIGAGAWGTVYAATHRNRSRVAIKVLHPEVSIDDQIRARFIRECYVANTIEHRGVVSLIDDDEAEDGSAFLVMELLSGEGVVRRMTQHGGRLPLPEALWIADQLLDVLAAAHAKGILHGDVKPDNLFLTSTGSLKVLDFGIAQLSTLAPVATRPAFPGTPGYASPEQARARFEEIDARSDLFSVGATLFSMVAGRPVHRADSSTEALAMTISMPASSVAQVDPSLPVGVIELIDTALRYRREDRWQDARSMQKATRCAWGDPPSEPTAELASFQTQRGETAPQQLTRMEPLPQPTTMSSLVAKGRGGLLQRLRLRGKVGGLVLAVLAIAAGTPLLLRLVRLDDPPSTRPSAALNAGDVAEAPQGRPSASIRSAPRPAAGSPTHAGTPHLTELRAARTTPTKPPTGATSQRAEPVPLSESDAEPHSVAPTVP